MFKVTDKRIPKVSNVVKFKMLSVLECFQYEENPRFVYIKTSNSTDHCNAVTVKVLESGELCEARCIFQEAKIVRIPSELVLLDKNSNDG